MARDSTRWFTNLPLGQKLTVVGMVIAFSGLVILTGFLVTIADISLSADLVRSSNELRTRTRTAVEEVRTIRDGAMGLLMHGKSLVQTMDEFLPDEHTRKEADAIIAPVMASLATLAGKQAEEADFPSASPVRAAWDDFVRTVTDQLPKALRAHRAGLVAIGDAEQRHRTLLEDLTGEITRLGPAVQASVPVAHTGTLVELAEARGTALLITQGLLMDRSAAYLDQKDLSELRSTLAHLRTTTVALAAGSPPQGPVGRYRMLHGRLETLILNDLIPALGERIRIQGQNDLEVFKADHGTEQAFQVLAGELQTLEDALNLALETKSRTMEINLANLVRKVWTTFWVDAGLLLGAFLVMFLFLILLAGSILHPLRAAMLFAGEVGEGRISTGLDKSRGDEFGALAASLLTMAATIQEATTSLEDQVTARTRELQQSLAHLRNTQDRLVASERIASMTPLLFGVAHELNTPLGNCVGAVSYLQDLVVPESESVPRYLITETLHVAASNLERAVRLINDFSGLSLIKDRGEPEEVDLREEITKTLALVSYRAPRHMTDFKLDLPGNPRLMLYREAFSSIMEQVLKNALDHWEDGASPGPGPRQHSAPRVDVRVRMRPDGGLEEVAIIDNGPGMDGPTLSRLGEPFMTTARGRGHTGLGLYVVRTLMEHRFGGSMSVSSEPGRGCTVSLWFPPLREDKGEPRPPEAQ